MSAEEKPSAGAFRELAAAVVIAESGPLDAEHVSECYITRDGAGTVRYYVSHGLEVAAEVYRDALATARARNLDRIADELADVVDAVRAGEGL